jgi:hypothetical protein
MTQIRKKSVVWIASVVACLIVVTLVFYFVHRRPWTMTGAITVGDRDYQKEFPIADVTVSADGLADAPVKSDSAGLFKLKLRKSVRRGDIVTLQFRHPNYQPLDLKQPLTSKLWIIRLTPIKEEPRSQTEQRTPVGDIQVKYSMNPLMAVNIGSAVRTIQVANVGNVPCNGQPPCSPDGRWKAAIASGSLDAGPGNEFRNARASCIAGPCPFTKIEDDNFSAGGQTITASVRNWSDTVTFLLEAEVFRAVPSQMEHKAYPVVFGRALSFTLPDSAEAVTIEADMAGETIIFPLGPSLYLSWATCNITHNRAQGKVYRCELKPGYKFQPVHTRG